MDTRGSSSGVWEIRRHRAGELVTCPRSARGAAILSALLLLGSIPAAEAAGASLQVGATVAPYCRVENVIAPGFVRVTREDAARGFVDLGETLRVRVRTNAPAGYRLVFAFDDSLAVAADLDGDGVHERIAPDHPTLPFSSAGPTRVSTDLNVRLWIAPDTPPGIYSFPLSVVSAEPAWGL